MYYLNTRYYDSSIGRFINEDTVEGQIDNPLSLNLYSYCYNNPLIFIDPTGNTAQDFLMGMGDVLFAGVNNNFVKWVLGKMGLGIKDYEYESAIDYYAGRVGGGGLLLAGSTGAIIKGIGTLKASVEGGAAFTIGSGGTLLIGGVAVCVNGVVVGSAEVIAGAAVFSSGLGGLGNDLNKLSELTHTYNSIKDAPKYPNGFQGVQNGTRKVNINNGEALDELRKIESGQWKKVYKDGYDAYGNEISIHYFESKSGKVFDVKVTTGWSN